MALGSRLDNSKFEKKLQNIEKRLFNLENAVFGSGKVSSSQRASSIEKLLVEKIDEIKTQNLVIISLKLHGKQTRDEIKKTLQDWGKVFGNWFKGGNFTNRLLKTNIVKSSEKNDKGKDIFSLTQKGELLADKLIKKIRG